MVGNVPFQSSTCSRLTCDPNAVGGIENEAKSGKINGLEFEESSGVAESTSEGKTSENVSFPVLSRRQAFLNRRNSKLRRSPRHY